jgi:hypothetical protein
MIEYKKRLAKEVNDKAVLLEEIGYEQYLKQKK